MVSEQQINQLIEEMRNNTASIKEYTESVNRLMRSVIALIGDYLTQTNDCEPADFDDEERQPTNYLDGSPIKKQYVSARDTDFGAE